MNNLSVVQSDAAAVMAQSASAVRLTISSPSIAAYNALTTHIPKEEMCLTASTALLAVLSAVIVDV